MDFFFKKYFYKSYVIGFDFGYIFLGYGYDILLQSVYNIRQIDGWIVKFVKYLVIFKFGVRG